MTDHRDPDRQDAARGDGAPAPADADAVRRRGRVSSLFSRGESMIWTTGGALVLCLAMIVGLIVLVVARGVTTFWPEPIALFQTLEAVGDAPRVHLGEVREVEAYQPTPDQVEALSGPLKTRAEALLAERGEDAEIERRMVRTANYDVFDSHFTWVPEFNVEAVTYPEWAVLVERMTWGRFYGRPVAFLLDGERTAESPEAAWALFQAHHGDARKRYEREVSIQKGDIGKLMQREEAARLDLRRLEMAHPGTPNAPEVVAAREAYAREKAAIAEARQALDAEIAALRGENERFKLVFEVAETLAPDGTFRGREVAIQLGDIVRAYPANQLGLGQKWGIYLGRWWEFLTDDPREANAEGGVWPAIFGTVLMTLIMTILVVPFGVLAALYLREYAKQGLVISLVRIAVGNLAGVPSIVFGVFGLGFFCYIVGGAIDEAFFAAHLSKGPVYGKGGLLWASLTLALLTLPVVVVATEEALAAVPNSMREGSYACGASKWQTMRRIVLPRAAPGIMTGTILAIARGAGEVAPLMLVGAVKMAPKLPVDGTAPFVHPERSFMHLGFHIYDLGFQSQNSEAAKPMVFTTTLLLISIVVALNILAIWIRARLRRAQEV